MTKFVLHGGETKIPNEHNKGFYREWIKDFKDDFVPTILLVYFARKEEELEYLENSDRERFARSTNNRLVNFVVANPDLNIFGGQVEKADVVYIRGGSSEKLMNALLPIKDKLLTMLKDKVYAGSSAGVMVLANLTRSTDTGWKKGFGLLPINAFVHFDENYSEDLESFRKDHPEDTNEYILLPETEFVIRNY